MRYDVEGRSPEWYALRKGRLTASDFAAAIGISPYCSRPQLWRYMTGRQEREQSNPRMDWGVENEVNALNWYECETGEIVLPGGFWTHDDHDWLGASPDGEHTDDQWIVEAKCPAEIHKEVPEHYRCQMQGQLEITGKDGCSFISWTPSGGEWFPVLRDKDYWAWMRPFLEEFWFFVQTDKEPPRLKAKPVYQPRKQ